jgi:hypothetical protein
MGVKRLKRSWRSSTGRSSRRRSRISEKGRRFCFCVVSMPVKFREP